MLTLGELRELTKDMPDNTPIVSVNSNYELRGAITDVSKYAIKRQKMKKVTRYFRDDFDGTVYPHDIYVHASNDEKNTIDVLQI